MTPQYTWRELLELVIEDPQQRQQLADTLGVAPITLIRWTRQEATPRPNSLRKLVQALPGYHESLTASIEQEFPRLSEAWNREAQSLNALEIPFDFYVRLLHMHATAPENLLFSLICDQILEQALKLLDPRRLGLAIYMLRCLSPAHGMVRSLQACAGRGTPPWEIQSQQWPMLLGAESLAGHALIMGHLETNQRLQESITTAPGYAHIGEESAVACPIQRVSRIAGCLLVVSTSENYFTPRRCDLIQHIAQLLSLAFDLEAFYPPSQIQLAVMPRYELQRPLLVQFRQRVNQLLVQSTNQQPLRLLQAEQMAWQQIEQELLYNS
jgi:transcriptional regulator with XRE-family HTH domain